MSQQRHYASKSALATGLAGRCPRCGKGKLFKGFLDLQPRCPACGLDNKFADAGDGPAVFVTLFAGFIVLGLALWTEITYEPPMWLHLLIFLPLALAVCLGMLRPLKGLLVALQYRNKAGQGRVEEWFWAPKYRPKSRSTQISKSLATLVLRSA
jgi:uncharacterized protein (DUF983 family)